MCEFKLMITRCMKSPRMLPTELLARWDESPLSTRCGFSRRPDAFVDRQPPSVLPLARPKGRTRNGREKVRIAPGAWHAPRLGFACRNGQLGNLRRPRGVARPAVRPAHKPGGAA